MVWTIRRWFAGYSKWLPTTEPMNVAQTAPVERAGRAADAGRFGCAAGRCRGLAGACALVAGAACCFCRYVAAHQALLVGAIIACCAERQFLQPESGNGAR